ncbi:hypothetical protein VF14_03260 [Nostoc linckia z18]|jgi:hypothetical protein|uniref:Uncharacterized protein n=2 Tax=Nostoc linckia TaxID=92942 RepID=A0A9Q5ZGQ5_NOSLI|nr:hypothetical protein [Nostoc linckia]PHK42397.1 hypothetical protein VF12_03275 [Nostoc linckia z15]PHK46905.1 hypothetical protein VF13_07900 [Nostoc linckia z16]PHJ69167.1 hypothetical protein VF02_00730 [Nostoc linckia z1]PHJ73318.1 hypothetical protein VF05_01745 [Nostoc linckia z3]PHJ78665.1 hypothetical protein VF03_00730 [Nostoc linckia z2]
MSKQERKIIINIFPACITNSGKTHVDEQVRTQDPGNWDGIGDSSYRCYMQISGFTISGRGQKIV